MDRRSAMGGAAVVPLALLSAQSSYAASPDSLMFDNQKLISAFFAAMNANNWAFVNAAIDPLARGKTDDLAWLAWSKKFTSSYGEKISRDRTLGFFESGEEIYSFLRFRQFEKGWAWSLPKNSDSIWSPDIGKFCSYSKWERTDGGSYVFGIPVPRNPTYVHFFQTKTEEEFGAVVSRKIDWLQEIGVEYVNRL